MNNELKNWKKYLAYIDKYNKKADAANRKKWNRCKKHQEEDKKRSDLWEKSYKKAMAERDARVKKIIKDYEELPFYKKIGTDQPNIFLPFPSSYNPFSLRLYWPMDLEPEIKPSYEEFLTMLSEDKL